MITSKFSFISSSRLYFQARVIICHSLSGVSAWQVALVAATCCTSLSLASKPSNGFNKSLLSSCWSKSSEAFLIKIMAPKRIEEWFDIWNDFSKWPPMPWKKNSPKWDSSTTTTSSPRLNFSRFAGALPITPAAPPPVVARAFQFQVGQVLYIYIHIYIYIYVYKST